MTFESYRLRNRQTDREKGRQRDRQTRPKSYATSLRGWSMIGLCHLHVNYNNVQIQNAFTIKLVTVPYATSSSAIAKRPRCRMG